MKMNDAKYQIALPRKDQIALDNSETEYIVGLCLTTIKTKWREKHEKTVHIAYTNFG